MKTHVASELHFISFPFDMRVTKFTHNQPESLRVSWITPWWKTQVASFGAFLTCPVCLHSKKLR